MLKIILNIARILHLNTIIIKIDYIDSQEKYCHTDINNSINRITHYSSSNFLNFADAAIWRHSLYSVIFLIIAHFLRTTIRQIS